MKKRAINKKTLIIAPILFLGIVLPRIASAISLPKMAEHAGIAILQAIGKLLTKLFSWLIDLAADFFESMLTVGFKGQQDIAKIGWDVTRDFANMLFILFMVVIAFATILRFERYGVKELLPKLILIALLINFSMVICYVIIDFTNIVADFFISDAKKGIPGSRDLTISAILADSFKLPDLYIPMVCDRYLIDLDDCYNLQTISESTRNNCIQQAEDGLNRCYAETENEKTEEDDFLDVIVTTIGSSAILMIAAFVLFAGGILLIVRMVAIWFLVMIAPLAFICYILPALRRNWESWWSQFIRWCLFAPAYSFFIWLACKISIEQKLSNISALSQSVSLRSPQAINVFFASTGNILNFLFIVGLLIGGLLAANQLGIKGAGTAMMIGKKWTNTAKGWAKKQAMKPVKGVGERAGAGAGMLRGGAMTTMGKMFGGKIGGRMAARGAQIKQSATERAYNKKYASMLGTMNKEDTLKEIETAMGSRKLIAIRSAQNRGFMREATTEQTAKAIDALARFGDVDSSRKLAELRPDAVTGNERKEAIGRAIANGTHKQWGKKVFESTDGKEIAGALKEQLGTGEFIKVFNGWAKDVRDKYETAVQVGFTNDFKDANNIKLRKDFASVTGKLDQAFYGDKDGKLNMDYSIDPKTKAMRTEWDSLVGSHVKGMKDEDFGKLKSATDRTLAAKYMTAAQVDGAGAKLSGSDKQFVKNILEELIKALPDTSPRKAERQKVYNSISVSTAWGGTPVKKEKIDDDFGKGRPKYDF